MNRMNHEISYSVLAGLLLVSRLAYSQPPQSLNSELSFRDILHSMSQCKAADQVSPSLSAEMGRLAPELVSVVSDLKLRDAGKTSKTAGSYVGRAFLQCGEKPWSVDLDEATPRAHAEFVYTIEKGADAKFTYYLDSEEMKRLHFSNPEKEVSYFRGEVQNLAGEPEAVRPCIIELEKLFSGEQKLDIKRFCAGRSAEETAAFEKDFAFLLQHWSKLKRK